MPLRTEVQRRHELAVINAAVAEHNRCNGLTLSVVSRPEPPDALLSGGGVDSWLEVTDAFFSGHWAKDLLTYASDERHEPMASGLYMDMDARVADTVCDLVVRKAAKASYLPLVQRYGCGILVVGLETPWLSVETFHAIDAEWEDRGRPNVSATFSHVYLGYRDQGENRAHAWLVP